MSNPIANLLSGLTPGVQSVPFRGPDGRFASSAGSMQLVPSVTLDVGPGRAGRKPSMGFDANGMPKGGITTSNGFRSNTFVQQQYMVNPFHNNQHYQIIQGQFVFLYHTVQEVQSANKKHLVHTVLSFPQLNRLLRRVWLDFKNAIQKGDPDARRVEELRKKIPEVILVEYARTQLPNGDEARAMHNEPKTNDGLLQNAEVAELYALAMKNDRFALILAPHFIWKRYKFAGVGDPGSYAQTGRVSVINTVQCGRAEVHDIFTPVKHMQVRSKLFFHLKRRKQADGTYGEFFIDPIVVANGPDPNGGNPNTYYDATGAGATGLLYEIGYVHQEPDTDDNDIVHERASGVDAIGDGEASRRATASCAKIFIELHKYN